MTTTTATAPSLKTNPFTHRQTEASKFGHFEGTWEELEALTLEHFTSAKPGYRDGVVLVPVPPERFWSSMVTVTSETELRTTFEARREGEEPFMQTVAVGTGGKSPAVAVDIVLYRHDVLAENDEHSCDADWEIISVNPRVTEEEQPMDPVTMARNFLQMAGGTKGKFSAEDFAKAIIFHSTVCQKG